MHFICGCFSIMEVERAAMIHRIIVNRIGRIPADPIYDKFRELAMTVPAMRSASVGLSAHKGFFRDDSS